MALEFWVSPCREAANAQVRLGLLAEDRLCGTELKWQLSQLRPQAPERAVKSSRAPCQPITDHRPGGSPMWTQVWPAVEINAYHLMPLMWVGFLLYIITVAADNWWKVTKQDYRLYLQWPFPHTALNLRCGFIKSCLWWQYNFKRIYLLLLFFV